MFYSCNHKNFGEFDMDYATAKKIREAFHKDENKSDNKVRSSKNNTKFFLGEAFREVYKKAA